MPWLGYFDLIDQVDAFIFLDTVQFEKQSWQHRNCVRGNNQLEWLTVPVLHKGRFGQSIVDVQVKTEIFPKKHLKTIQQLYNKAPGFNRYWPELEHIFKSVNENPSLAELNIKIIKWIIDCLGISTELIRAKDLIDEGKRSVRLISILKQIGATQYLSPLGAATYLSNDIDLFQEANIEVLIHQYEHPVYEQLKEPFIIGASIIDMLFCNGGDGLEIIRSGRKKAISIQNI